MPSFQKASNRFYRRYGKRWLDLIFTTLGLVVLAPVLLVLILMIRIGLGRPVFFRQARLGMNGNRFSIIKFRTMTNQRDATGDLLPDEQRLTGLGRFLRRTSLDELPELLNVLRGEMSLVGPRPLHAHYAPRYTQEQMRRHAVRPGLTGWAQVNGRNALSWECKFDYDVWYVDHYSFGLDVQIVLRTMLNVLRRQDINQPGHSTVEEFMGSNMPE